MALGILLCCLAALLPILLLYIPNTAEMSFGHVLPYFGVLILLGVIAWAGMYLISRRKNFAAVAAAVWLLVLLNVGRIVPPLHTVFPLVGIKVIAPVVLVLLAGITWGLSRLKEGFLNDAKIVLTIALAAMILSTAVTALVMPNKSEGDQVAPREETAETGDSAILDTINLDGAEGTDRPNIYWLIFDEYAGDNELKKYYHYDNPLSGTLAEMGFTVSENSYNWNTSTYRILQYITALQYTGANDLAAIRQEIAEPDRPLWTLLRRLGYQLYDMETADKFSLTNLLDIAAKKAVPQTVEGQTLLSLLLEYSILYRYEHEIADRILPAQSAGTVRDTILKVLDAAEHISRYRAGSPAFTFVYLHVPHAPYLFDRNGDAVDKEQEYNWKDKQYYLDQLIYTTGRMESICRAIIRDDPDSIIILQSDHGQRLVANVTNLDSTNILNAVYFRGEAIEEIKDKNGLNTWINVLNRQFRLNIREVKEVRVNTGYREGQRDPELEDPNAEE